MGSELSKAAEAGDVETVARLLDEQAGDLEAGASRAKSVLFRAVNACRGEQPPDVRSHHPADPQHMHCRARAEVVRLLLRAGANAQAQESKWGMTPVMLAARCGCVPVLRAMRETLGPGIFDTLHAHGDFTPLMSAAEMARVDAVRFMLETGADVTVCNKRGMTALTVASGGLPVSIAPGGTMSPHLARYLQGQKDVRQLLEQARLAMYEPPPVAAEDVSTMASAPPGEPSKKEEPHAPPVEPSAPRMSSVSTIQPSAPPLNATVSDNWTVDEVAAHLKLHGLDTDTQETFRAQKIDGAALRMLTEDDMREMHISIGERKTIQRMLRE